MTVCSTGKVGHASKRSAAAAARRLRERGGRGLQPYRCPSCETWHVGSPRIPPAPPAAFRRPPHEVPPTAAGTVHCQRPGCGHPVPVHLERACVGRRGSCDCSGLVLPAQKESV